MIFGVIISNFWTIMSIPQKVVPKRLGRIAFFLELFEPKQLFQKTVYQTPISCLTWSKQLKSSQIVLFVQKVVVIKHPLFIYSYAQIKGRGRKIA